MKRPLAVLLIACLVTSCRSSQPTTNPFLRTTVPPPASPGVVVTPGQPYAAGISPPMVTSPAPPVVTTPPVVTQPVPVAPAPAPAPLTPPPSVAPQGDQFQPPGGSYLFHQSSNQPQSNPAQLDPVRLNPTPSNSTPLYPVQQATHLAANTPTSGPVTQVAFAAPAVAAPQTTTQPGMVINPYVQPAAAATLAPATLATVPTGRGDPPEAKASLAVGGAQPPNTIRILGPSQTLPQPIAIPAAPATSSSANTPVIKMTVGGHQSSLVTTVPGATAPGAKAPAAANLSIGATTAAQNSAQFVAPAAAGSGVVQTAFQPAAGGAKSDYAHSPDYSMLRGKLEYSQSLRQWKLRYIPIDGRTDDFGGSVVLDDSPALAAFKPGEFVALRGLLSGGGAKASGYAPRYLITAIERTSR